MLHVDRTREEDRDPEFRETERLPAVGRCRVTVGGAADRGAATLPDIRDGEELDVVQEDLGSGYTAVRRTTGEHGFVPTTSIVVTKIY